MTFETDGYLRVPGAFGRDAAERMQDLVWDALREAGVDRDDPTTWTVEFPSHLQALKREPVFGSIGSERTVAAINALLGEGTWPVPKDWGAFFVTFPSKRAWEPPPDGWHLDHPYTDPLDPPAGLKVHALFGDIAPRAGGMTVIEGSHRVVAKFATERAGSLPERPAAVRKALLASDPWFKALAAPGDPEQRVGRFVSRSSDVNGVEVRVAELTGEAGDVILIHPLLLHARPINAGIQPRFLLNKDMRRR